MASRGVAAPAEPGWLQDQLCVTRHQRHSPVFRASAGIYAHLHTAHAAEPADVVLTRKQQAAHEQGNQPGRYDALHCPGPFFCAERDLSPPRSWARAALTGSTAFSSYDRLPRQEFPGPKVGPVRDPGPGRPRGAMPVSLSCRRRLEARSSSTIRVHVRHSVLAGLPYRTFVCGCTPYRWCIRTQ